MAKLTALCLSILFCLSTAIPSFALEKSPLNTSYLRNYAETRGFMLGRPVKAKPTPDGKSVLFLRAQARLAQQGLYTFDVETGKTRELITPEQVLKGAAEHLSAEEKARRERQRISVGGFTDFQISDDSSQILVSLSGKLYAITLANGKIQQLETGADILDPKFSPDAKSVSYVQENDIFVLNLASGIAQRVTTGGSNEVTHGLAEFVAQEEMDRFSGYWWSPDSKFIAYEESNASGVETWHLSDPQHPEQPPIPNYYPRPGKANVKARVGTIPSSGGKTTWIDWDSKSYPYLASVSWTKNAGLSLVVLSRDQRELRLLAADAKTGSTKTLLSESDKDWINLRKYMPAWLDDGSGFLWISESAGAAQLELHDKNGKLNKVVVGPEAGLIGFVESGVSKDSIYYIASTDPKEAQLHSVSLADGKSKTLTKERGIHYASLSKTHNIYVLEKSLFDSMPQTSVHRADGSLIGSLPSVAEEPNAIPQIEFAELEGKHKYHANIVRPQNFDRSLRYPTIVDVYGGPGKIKVVATRRNFLLDQWLADQGFIIVSIDGRGTPGRGRDWERAIKHHFGSVPLDDQVDGIQALIKMLPEIDKDRIGMTGWSFGGYMSGLAVLRRPDIFKAAVAGAPVVDWFDYDSCYTERYLGLPEKNPEAYKEASLLSYAAELQRPLLLVHGTTDDNVFFKHSLELADALFRSGREFAILPLSGLTHMVPDPVVMEQLWSRIVSHFHTHLGKPESANKQTN